MASKIRVGVSGFSYPAWKGKFYQKEEKNDDLLVSYSKRLDCVEINSSFYGAPRLETVKSWEQKTGSDFVFAFKAPRLITHITKLGTGSDEAANRFSNGLEPLGPRRGPLLFQLPPFLKRDMKLLESFLSRTESIRGRVFEFRNESWLDDSVFTLLEKEGVGFCIAETEDMKPDFRVTSDTAYFRLRKERYGAKEIDAWAGLVAKTSADAKETYVFLRHDETGDNALLAERLAHVLAT